MKSRCPQVRFLALMGTLKRITYLEFGHVKNAHHLKYSDMPWKFPKGLLVIARKQTNKAAVYI